MKVSIGVPIYGVEKFIERCVVSLFEQTYDNIEYIFVNDCTRDRSLDILNKVIERYPNRKPQIRVVNHERNRGLAAARNTFIENATGDYVWNIDSDDWIEYNAVELLVEKALKYKADIINVGCVVHLPDKRKQILCAPNLNKENLIREMVLGNIPCGVVFRFVKLSIYKDNLIHAIEGANMGEDYNVSPKLLWNSNKIISWDRTLYNYDKSNCLSYTNVLSISNYTQSLRNKNAIEDYFVGKMDDICGCAQLNKAKMIVNSLSLLSYKGSDKELWKMYLKEASKIDKKMYSKISIVYRPFLYTKNYYLMRLYSIIAHVTYRLIKNTP